MLLKGKRPKGFKSKSEGEKREKTAVNAAKKGENQRVEKATLVKG